MQVNLQTIARENAERHHSVDELKADGVHYTPLHLAQFVAAKIVSRIGNGAKSLSILDPATGDGELLIALLAELDRRGISKIEVHGFETSSDSIAVARERIRRQSPSALINLVEGDFLQFVLNEHGHSAPSLFDEPCNETRFDLVIANPPYVRTQVLGASQAQQLSHQFGLSGRIDLYHAFLLGIARVLKPRGTAGVIVSNRFMTTKSGTSVRADLLRQFNPVHVWDLGDTKLFSAAVLPAVLLLERKLENETTDIPARFTSIYSTKLSGDASEAADPIKGLSMHGLVEMPDGIRFMVQDGLLDHGEGPEDVWRVATKQGNDWLETVSQKTWQTFGEVSKIRVGVKTTADRVFIRKDWHTFPENEKPELLRPLITHHSARRFHASVSKEPRGIVYPHEVVNGRRTAVELESFPNTKRYLESHRSELESRTYVTGSGRKWYEVWVPQDPDVWQYPKLVFRDISEQPTFWIDLEGGIVNGDCYWMSSNDHENDELLWLALAVGNSTFIEAFYDRRFNNKLYAGRRRFMTQYVEKFPLPDPRRDISQAIIRLAKKVYEEVGCGRGESSSALLNELVWESFGLPVEKV